MFHPLCAVQPQSPASAPLERLSHNLCPARSSNDTCFYLSPNLHLVSWHMMDIGGNYCPIAVIGNIFLVFQSLVIINLYEVL